MNPAQRAPALAATPPAPIAELHTLAPQPDRRLYPSLPAVALARLRRVALLVGHRLLGAGIWARAELSEQLAPGPRILRADAGYAPASGRAVCLYASFAQSGRVSEMVLRQLEEYTLLGFDVVFVTTSRDIPPADWEAVRARCTLALQRRNYGLDFGSWSDAAREVREQILGAGELLLTNDSILGPIRPLAPVFATLRAGGDGVFGLTESLQQAIHLQSYLLLARGRGAVDDLLGFLLSMRLSARKAVIIRRGELTLSRHMARRGHRVAALYGYANLEAAILADPVESRRLLGMAPFATAIGLPPAARRARLHEAMLAVQLNPTHHLWTPLIRLCGFPFIKTELVTKNPAGVPDAPEWETLVPPDAPCPLPVLRTHIATVAKRVS